MADQVPCPRCKGDDGWVICPHCRNGTLRHECFLCDHGEVPEALAVEYGLLVDVVDFDSVECDLIRLRYGLRPVVPCPMTCRRCYTGSGGALRVIQH